MVENGAADAHKWLKKPEERQMIQAERVGNKVLSTPDELLGDRPKLWTNGANTIVKIKSTQRQMRETAMQEAGGRSPLAHEVNKACEQQGNARSLGVNCWSPKESHLSPSEATRDLTSTTRQAERKATALVQAVKETVFLEKNPNQMVKESGQWFLRRYRVSYTAR